MATYKIVKEKYKRIKNEIKIDNVNLVNSSLRILAGTVDVSDIINNSTIELTECYFETFKIKYPSPYSRACHIFEVIDENLTISDYSGLCRKINTPSFQFFQTFNDELIEFVLNQTKQKYTNAFVNIYRMLEHISYAFPLVYTSKTLDFKKTYRDLRSFFAEDRSIGELKFFSNFLNKSLADPTLLNSEFKISLTGPDYQKQKFYDVISNICKRNKIPILDSSIENEVLIIEWKNVSNLIVNVRNGYFHYLNDNPNVISSDDIIDADLFFEKLNSCFMHWFTVLYSYMLSSIFDNITVL